MRDGDRWHMHQLVVLENKCPFNANFDDDLGCTKSPISANSVFGSLVGEQRLLVLECGQYHV